MGKWILAIFKVRILDMYNSEVSRANLNFRIQIAETARYNLLNAVSFERQWLAKFIPD